MQVCNILSLSLEREKTWWSFTSLTYFNGYSIIIYIIICYNVATFVTTESKIPSTKKGRHQSFEFHSCCTEDQKGIRIILQCGPASNYIRLVSRKSTFEGLHFILKSRLERKLIYLSKEIDICYGLLVSREFNIWYYKYQNTEKCSMPENST